ncbi:unnamed protein product [Meganyctiphanes norvegica]|uniref:Heterochromatin protein 1 n=1 Tax=Meganyctiphanes norvegica TaxID=48144 RepID=A0AAV2R9S4_MEGNR
MTDEMSTADEEEEYSVEKIIDKRIRKGKVEYYLKWKGYGDEDNTWEPEEHLDCPELIAEYEARKKIPPSSIPNKGVSIKEKKERGRVKKTLEEPPGPRGYERGLNADEIIGATDAGGELTYLMKWIGSEEADMVPARIVNARSPHIVIKFYDGRMSWKSS